MPGERMESFRVMEWAGESDGFGGQRERRTAGKQFGALATREGEETLADGGLLLTKGQVMHETCVRLKAGQVIRRERDGALYRVMSNSEMRVAPDGGRLRFAQVGAERLMGTCGD